MLTLAEAATIIRAIRLDPRPFMESSLLVLNKQGEWVPFVLNAAQRVLLDRVMAQIRAGKPVRMIVCKARQLGISTFVQALLFTMLYAYANRRAKVVADERLTSQFLLSKSIGFKANLDASIRPVGTDTVNKLRLDCLPCADGTMTIDSELEVNTATGKEIRGHTVQYLHISEVASYVDPERTLGALLPEVLYAPGTMIFIESTAKRVDDSFHRRYLKAEKGESAYEAVFLPWFLMPEYAIAPPEGWLPSVVDEEYGARFGLTPAQLYWRRLTIDSDYEGDEEAFSSEYPSTAEEAFKAVGQQAFNAAAIAAYIETAKQRTYQDGTLGGGVFLPNRRGKLRVWDPPVAGHEYLIGVDTSLGVEGGDDSVAQVLDRTTQSFVARIRGKLHPHQLAADLEQLGLWYHTARISIELNHSSGLATQLELVEHLRYPKPYIWRQYDNASKIWTNKLGWMTTVKTRPLMIDDLAWAVKERIVGIADLELLGELSRFDLFAPRPGDDDAAMAAMVAWVCHMHMPMADGVLPRRPRPTEVAEAPEPNRFITIERDAIASYKGEAGRSGSQAMRDVYDPGQDDTGVHDDGMDFLY